MWARIWRASALWWETQRFSNASVRAGILDRIRPLANSASTTGSA